MAGMRWEGEWERWDADARSRSAGRAGGRRHLELPVTVSLQAYANAVKPDFAADWLLRFQIQFPFPK